MSAALQAPVQEARDYVREALSVNADETGWREKLKKAWLWVAATALVTVFAINRERSGKAAQQLLGKNFVGFVGTEPAATVLGAPAARLPEMGGQGRSGKAILQLESALWAVVHMDQVEPTNNRAERALRPAVCMRKGSFGTHNSEGSRYIERMLTTVTTLQQRNVLDYLSEAMCAHLHGQAAPSPLPIS